MGDCFGKLRDVGCWLPAPSLFPPSVATLPNCPQLSSVPILPASDPDDARDLLMGVHCCSTTGPCSGLVLPASVYIYTTLILTAKQGRTWIVLGWETAWETGCCRLLASRFHPLSPSCRGASQVPPDSSLLLRHLPVPPPQPGTFL